MYLPDKAGRRRATAVFLLPSLVGIIGFCLLPIAGRSAGKGKARRALNIRPAEIHTRSILKKGGAV